VVSLDYPTLISQVQDRTGTAEPEAATITRATLVVFGSGLDPEIVEELSAQLPPEIGQLLTAAAVPQEGLTLDGFIDRIAAELGINRQEAASRAEAVMDVMRGFVHDPMWQKMRDKLPQEWRTWLDLRDKAHASLKGG
jgi:uncharacterized protein (DUF2267 family)